MRFIDRHRYRGAVNLAGRSVHDSLGTVLSRGLEYVQRANHIGVNIRLCGEVGIGYCDQCSKVKHDFVAMYEAIDESCIANVATDKIDFPSDRFRQVVQPAMAVEGIVLSQSSNVGSCRNKRFGQVRTNEAVGSCYENPGTVVVHCRLVHRLLAPSQCLESVD